MFRALRHYVCVDRKTRIRNNMISVVLGTMYYMICYEMKFSEKFAMNTSLVVFFVSFTVFVLLYMLKHRHDEYDVSETSPVQRLKWRITLPRDNPVMPSGILLPQWLVSAVAFVLIIGLVGTGAPVLEGAIVDARLNKNLQGEPTRAKLEETAQIVSDAAEHKLHVSPALVVKAANHFATYRSSLVGLPLTFSQLTPLTGTPTDPKGPPIKYGTGCATPPIAGAEADSGNIFGFGATVRVDGCADLVIWPMKPEVLRLDNLKSKNVTFVNTILEYNGGNLKLENVRFINCTFQISDANATNQNVLKLLSAALSGQRINLELTA